MKTIQKDIINDLKLLIDISCVESEEASIFETFHKMLIRISYKAAHISIDYDRQRVYMNVISDDKFYDLGTLNHPLAPTMSVNLVYKDLSAFLKSCIIEDTYSLNYYYPTLISRFFNRNKEEANLEELQIV